MFKTPIDFNQLIKEGCLFEVEPPDEDIKDEVAEEEENAVEKELYKFANLNCIGQFEDEDTYGAEPFTTLASKMENLVEDGVVKKRIIREGYGEKPADKSIVKVHYNAYTEYIEEPFDSTYARKKVHDFRVGNGEVLLGLDYAVQSMKLNEKSQFLVQPEFAYGKLGCLDRVPAEATVLFEIELLEIVNSGAAEIYQNLPEEKKKEFAEVYKFCVAQSNKGKDIFHRNIKGAIKEYNIAVSKLESAQLREYDEQVKQQELLIKLYSNLLVCYTKTEEPKRGCVQFNKINDLTRGTDFKIPAKVYFNNAKCLRMLGEFELAKKRLHMAYKLEPRNPEILAECKNIDEEHKKYLEKQKAMSKAFVGGK